MNDAERYFQLGYQVIDFDTTKLQSLVESALTETIQNEKKYQFVSKYVGTSDFRPCVAMFNDGFVDTLFDNNIMHLLSDVVGSKDMTLVHCQLRHVSGTQARSYMSWHRDTYLKGDVWVGNTPPVHKIIVYLENKFQKNEPRLNIIPGSHRKMFDQDDMDISKFSDVIEKKQYDTIHSSNEKALLFNTALLHDVVPETPGGVGSFRIIYSFATQKQYEEKYSCDVIHRAVYTRFNSTKKWKGF